MMDWTPVAGVIGIALMLRGLFDLGVVIHGLLSLRRRQRRR
jgi:hypothetical protein